MAQQSPPATHAGRRGRLVAAATLVELGIGAIAVALIFGLVLIQAAQRYLPFDGWAFTGELARFSMVWLTFTVTGALVTSDSHISLQLLDGAKSVLVRRVVRVFASLVVAVVGVGLATECWSLMTDQGPLKSPAMGMPMAWLYVLPFLGFVSTAIRATVAAVDFALHGAPEASGPEIEELV